VKEKDECKKESEIMGEYMRETESMCVCVRERERERERDDSEWVCNKEKDIVSECVCDIDSKWVYEREREHVWENRREIVIECVRVGERESECVCVWERERENVLPNRSFSTFISCLKKILRNGMHQNKNINLDFQFNSYLLQQ